MADLLEVLRTTSIALSPFMPETARKMWVQLGLGEDPSREVDAEELAGPYSESVSRRFPEDLKVSKGEPLFPRIK